MTLKETMQALEKLGSEQTKKVLSRHGARDFYGVKISDLKLLIKKTGRDQNLARELYKTGNSDAMYMAGLMINPKEISEELLEEWMDGAYWYMLSEYTVAGVAAESPHGLILARRWIDSPSADRAAAGWSVWAGLLALGSPDLDSDELINLMERVVKIIHQSPNRVRYCMNNFIISLGIYCPELTRSAIEAAGKIGKVKVYMGDTSCKVPDAVPYINNAADRNKIGIHRKHVVC